MYALVLNESRILKWEGRNKERRTKSTKKKDVKKTSLTKRKKVKSRSRGGRTERQTRQRHQRSKTSNKVQPTVWVLVLAHPYLISKFILPGQLHTLFVQPCWQRQVHSQKAAVFTSHLFISATKASKHASKHATVSWEEEVWVWIQNAQACLEKNLFGHL